MFAFKKKKPMNLNEVRHKIFENDLGYIDSVCDQQKKQNELIAIEEKIKRFFDEVHNENNSNFKEDSREGRIGTASVYFVFDRSYGIMSVSQSGLNLMSACRFATICASCGVFSGKWMYELHLGSNEVMQLGWCSNKCTFTIDRGCGDTLWSYAYDGYRRKSWNVVSVPYGEAWKIGDVIGICIDLVNGLIEFYRNGESMGIAFSNLLVGADMMYFPCVSLADTQTVYANFGGRPFRYPVEGYDPLQDIPRCKNQQSEIVLRWMKKLVDILHPKKPEIYAPDSENDISDKEFWNRLYSFLCFQLSNTLVDSYCTFKNFLPFLYSLNGPIKDTNEIECGKLLKLLDECWINVKQKYMEKALFNIFHFLILSFKEVSKSLESTKHPDILRNACVLVSHITTRKYFISSFLFDSVDVFMLLHHRPFDQKAFEEFVNPVWWDTKGCIAAVEGRKINFVAAFTKIEKFYNSLESVQCSFANKTMINVDGSDESPSSRSIFLRNLRKYFWRELDLFRNEIYTNVPTNGAYAFLLRFMFILNDLWNKEVPNEELKMPPTTFYDQSIKYHNCERIGGVEPFLFRQMRDEINIQLNERTLESGATSTQSSVNIPVVEVRGIRTLNEIVNFLGENEITNLESLSLPLPALNTAVVHSLFAPFYLFSEKEYRMGNINCKQSLLELFEDLTMFMTTTAVKHCRKMHRSLKLMEQSALDYNIFYMRSGKPANTKGGLHSDLSSINKTLELYQKDAETRARKGAWIKYVLLNNGKYKRFIQLFQAHYATIQAAESQGELFAFLPDFYLEACLIFVEILVRNFAPLRPVAGNEECRQTLFKMADLMIHIFNDKRIKNIDSKKIPINVLAMYVSSSEAMDILNSLEMQRSKELINKLLVPYSDRIWTETNWIIMRFWQGNGFGFRYVSLPHHASIPDPARFPFVYNLDFNPSEHYQKLIREHLLNRNRNIETLIDSMISELHWIFGEFLASSQELQRSLEKNEQMMLTNRHFKACSTNFDRTIALLRVFDMFFNLAPEIFVESYYAESISFTKRIIQIVLLIVNRIASQQGCFRTVVNSRISSLENVEYFPVASASTAILLNILKTEMESFSNDNNIVPPCFKMVLTDPNYDFNSLSALIGSPDCRTAKFTSLHDYLDIMHEEELEMTRRLLLLLETYMSMISKIKIIPDEEICTICYASKFDVIFEPCKHKSCLSCVSYHIKKSRLCFFCKGIIRKVINIETNISIPELTDITLNVTHD